MKYGIKFTRPDTKPTIIVIELLIIRIGMTDFCFYYDCNRMNNINEADTFMF